MSPNFAKNGDNLDRMNMNQGAAIIGMACLFPGARDLATYWHNIINKVDAVTEPPAGAWNPTEFYNGERTPDDQIYCTKGGFLAPIADFNPLEYGIMPMGLEGGEPDQWLALKVAYDALNDAGYLERLRANPEERKRAAVIFGKGTYLNRGNLNMVQHSLVVDQTIRILRTLHPEYSQAELAQIRADLTDQLPPFNAESAPGLVPNITAGRVANRLDLMGPAYTVDAACASSLIAIEHAVNELNSHRCDLVLVGGVHVSTPAPILALFSRLGALSHQQMIRPFDERADGTILSEGIGIVVLKRAEDATRDGDRVYAVINGVGSSSDGRGMSVLTPRLEGEVLALQRAFAMAGVEPESVGLIEAHGTGTAVGDRTEIQALRTIFGDRGDELPYCALGTVKSMIGHTMPAAGIAGVIKVALALYHKVLPPTIHVEQPDPRLELEKSAFYLNTEVRPWIHGNADTPRRAGVNAFGFGGVNAHVLLQEAQEADAPTTVTTPAQDLTEWDSELVVLGAASRAALVEMGRAVLSYCAANPASALLDIAHTLTAEAVGQPVRLAVVAESVADLCLKLEQALGRLEKPTTRQIKDVRGIYFFDHSFYAPEDVDAAPRGKVAFLFPGEGAQYPHMLADLCIHFPEVRACFDRIDRLFANHPRGFRPSDFIFPRPAFADQESALGKQLWQIDGAIEAVLTANMAMWTLLEQLGIPVDACLGHSTGEYSALLAAGAITVSNEEFVMRYLLELNRRYHEVQHETEVPRAVMVALGTGLEQVEAIINDVYAAHDLTREPTRDAQAVEGASSPQVYISMDNCLHQTVALGDADLMAAVMANAQAKGIICEVLPFDRGYHSPLFAPYNHLYEDLYNALPLATPKTPIYSCVTAAPFADDVTQIRRLAIENWISRVRFRETVQAMYNDGFRIFVEVGPRGNLTSFTGDILRGQPHLAIAANTQHRSGLSQLNHLLALLCAQKVPVDLHYYYQRRNPRAISFAATDAATNLATEPGAAQKRAATLKLATRWVGMEISDSLVQQLRSNHDVKQEKVQAASQEGHQNGNHASHPVRPPTHPDELFLRPLNERRNTNSGSDLLKLEMDEHRSRERQGQQTMKQANAHDTNGTGGANGIAEHSPVAPTAYPAQDFLAATNGVPARWQHAEAPAQAEWVQDERTVVMQAHLQLMQQFLHTQEAIMLNYLAGGGATPQRPIIQSAPATITRFVPQRVPHFPAHTPASTPIPAQSAGVSPTVHAAPTAPAPKAVAPTVPRPVSVEVEAPLTEAPRADVSQADMPQNVDVKAILLRLVSDRTGYPQEMLDLKANLEADLGIDSIKRVEILGAFNRETKLLSAKDIDHVSTLKSLGAILDFFHKSSL